MTSDPVQSTTYSFDLLGNKIGEQIALKAKDQTKEPFSSRFNTQTRLDPATGLASSKSLFDGRILTIERGSLEEGASVQALKLQNAQAAWLQNQLEDYLPKPLAQALSKLLPSTRIASNIQIDPFDGLTGYRTGGSTQNMGFGWLLS